MKRRKSSKKPRTQFLQATTKSEVSEINVTVGQDGKIRFGSPMIHARIEAYYDRQKKPKVVHRIGIESDRMYLDSDMGLLASYDRIFWHRYRHARN